MDGPRERSTPSLSSTFSSTTWMTTSLKAASLRSLSCTVVDRITSIKRDAFPACRRPEHQRASSRAAEGETQTLVERDADVAYDGRDPRLQVRARGQRILEQARRRRRRRRRSRDRSMMSDVDEDLLLGRADGLWTPRTRERQQGGGVEPGRRTDRGAFGGEKDMALAFQGSLEDEGALQSSQERVSTD